MEYDVVRFRCEPPKWAVVPLDGYADYDGAIVSEYRDKKDNTYHLYCFRCDFAPCPHTLAVAEKVQGFSSKDTR